MPKQSSNALSKHLSDRVAETVAIANALAEGTGADSGSALQAAARIVSTNMSPAPADPDHLCIAEAIRDAAAGLSKS